MPREGTTTVEEYFQVQWGPMACNELSFLRNRIRVWGAEWEPSTVWVIL